MKQTQKWYDVFCNCSGRPRRHPGDCCLRITNTPVYRPDLAVYSQTEEVALGREPTWNSPDITTNDWGPFRLMESIGVRITNRSAKANAGNALINLYIGTFGIGMPVRLYASQKTTVWAGNAVDLLFPLDETLRSADSPQRLSVMVKTEHPYDTEPINNTGFQCIDGRQTSLAGRHFSVDIPIRNPHPSATRRIDLQVKPGPLTATISWDHYVFGPLEEKIVRLDVTVPDEIHESDDTPGKLPVTVIATYNGGSLLGGATIIARIDS
ncbi:MAG: hypothetical protein OEL83_15910 [Desulforhopalus sp.]|nr:hypothetical protein [Desulforhopalus sp.]